MKKLLLLFLVLPAIPAAALTNNPYDIGCNISTATGKSTCNLSGQFNVTKSSANADATPTVQLDGTSGITLSSAIPGGNVGITFQDGSFQNTAATGTLSSANVWTGTTTWTAPATFTSSVTFKNSTYFTGNTGNVGVGTSAPAFSLEVSTPGGAHLSTAAWAGSGLVVAASGNVGVSSATPAGTLGVGGTIIAASTITGSYFVGNGAGLTNIANVQYATTTANTWLGNNIFAASITVTGIFIPNAVPSTFTVLSADFRADNSEPTCLANSTITFTTDQSAFLHVDAQITIETYNANNNHCSVLFDGKYDTPFSTSKPMFQANFGAANRTDFPVTVNYTTQTSFVAGSHSICLTCNGDTGGTRGLTCAGAPCWIRATEIR